jgi:outer membrane protein assembly factor BamB
MEGGAQGEQGGYGASYSGAICLPASDAVQGNVLVSDQLNNRVIEVTRAGTLVWSFGDGRSVPGPTSVVAPNDAERLPDGRTLISGTGASAGSEPTCPALGSGCADNRVILVDASGTIVWQYGADGGRSGRGPNELNAPVAAVFVPKSGGNDILITDQGNNRVIEVSEQTKQIVWQYPPDSVRPEAKETLQSPNSAQRLANGHTLIADEGGDRVIEVDVAGAITWQYPAQMDLTLMNGPAFASRLPDGHTLITDTNNNRVVELDTSTPPNIVWLYSTADLNPSVPSPLPTRAVRLASGHTLITDQFNQQVIEIDASPQHYIVFAYGMLGVAGRGPGELNAPYDAKVIDDYTGLTSPL